MIFFACQLLLISLKACSFVSDKDQLKSCSVADENNAF